MTISPDPLPDEDAIVEFLENQLGRFMKNLNRARGLVDSYELLVKLEGEEEEVHSDILRSAVVFVHATLEDLLRSVAEVFLPYSDEETLNKIPLAGTAGPNRSEKFSLGKLAAHRGKSILDVVRESVAHHLLTSTYNDTTQISVLLNSVKINVDGVRQMFPQLDVLIKRRHQIVHRADRNQQEEIEPVTSGQVQEWIDIVMNFMATILSDIAQRRFPKKET